MCSSLLHLAPGSRDLSQAEKRIITDYGRLERKSPSLNGRKSTPTTKFLGTAEAYFVCHIGPIFQIYLIYAFTVNNYRHSIGTL